MSIFLVRDAPLQLHLVLTSFCPVLTDTAPKASTTFSRQTWLSSQRLKHQNLEAAAAAIAMAMAMLKKCLKNFYVICVEGTLDLFPAVIEIVNCVKLLPRFLACFV
jgi:hypothetical protein